METACNSSNWADADWREFRSVLPEGWEDAARALGAIRIAKGPLSDPDLLMRTLLGHIAGDHSLRLTAGYARNSGLVAVSDVAVLGRLRNAADWFEWVLNGMLEEPVKELPAAPFRLRLMDATCISKPGSTGTDFRLHVAIDLPNRTFTQVQLTGVKGSEGMDRFPLAPGDLAVADRAYGLAKAIEYVRDRKAHILARVNVSSLPMFRRDGSPIDPLQEARQLKPEENRELDVCVRLPSGRTEFARLCIHALTEEQADKAQRRLKRKRARKQEATGPRAFEAARYVILITTLPKAMVPLAGVFAIYRLRWQIELSFKTLKQVAGVGRVPHKLEEPGRAWLLGKVICAMALQRLAARREAFPPCEDACSSTQVNTGRSTVALSSSSASLSSSCPGAPAAPVADRPPGDRPRSRAHARARQRTKKPPG
jgi:hypothetical protein